MCRKNDSPIEAILNDLKSNISRDSVGYAHITGENYRACLKHFGATEEDLQLMESGSLHKDIQVDIEPTMFFRQVSQFTTGRLKKGNFPHFPYFPHFPLFQPALSLLVHSYHCTLFTRTNYLLPRRIFSQARTDFCPKYIRRIPFYMG